MGWAVGYDETWKRDIGYGVPAYCDHPGCNAKIDRGLSHVCCEQQPYGGEHGCGLYFCGKHLGFYCEATDELEDAFGPCCERCAKGPGNPFPPTPEHPEWMEHKLHDPSWEPWRKEHPKETSAIRKVMAMCEAGYDAKYYPMGEPK